MKAAKKLAATAAKKAARECLFLEAELETDFAGHNAQELREGAGIFERWAAQLRFKADLMDGRKLESTHWIRN